MQIFFITYYVLNLLLLPITFNIIIVLQHTVNNINIHLYYMNLIGNVYKNQFCMYLLQEKKIAPRTHSAEF